MGYSKQIIKGFSWSAVLSALSMAVSFGKVVILSHFVFGPVEFGVFGIGVLTLGILELMTETGINVFLVQETEPLATYLDTAWVTSILRGIVISFFLILLSYPIAIFFRITSNWTFILAFALLPLFRGFINPAIANLQKNLKFKEDSLYRFFISVVEDLAIIIIALLTHNVFSFIAGMLIGVLFEVSVTFIFIKERPSFNFEGKHFKKIIGQGKWITIALIFDYLFEHMDDLVVGKILNVFSLGIYQNSYTLAGLPERLVGQQIGKVTFPVFVNFINDKARLRRAFFRLFLSTLVIVTPFAFALFFLSEPVIRVTLGTKWLAAIPVLRILSLFALARAVTNLFYPLFLAFKKQNYITYSTLVSMVVLLVLIFPLTNQYGISGAAASALAGSLVAIPVEFYYLHVLTRSK